MSGLSASPRSTPITISSNGDNTVIAAISPTGPIHVVGISFTVDGATNITFKDGSTAKTGTMILTGNGSSVTWPLQERPYFSIIAGSSFVLNSSNSVNIGGIAWYVI